ncbi:anti-sigma factor family protein [Candidatus Palauibacter sp.]|uniref:anti-sigma factor family protein n=1 Tax=Candidatus Palauibacter sp. TaxID=3101350 RepID=UPI003AF2177D
MTEHMNAERISALLDEPWADHDCQAHLETCEDCQAEFERLSRLRMALSALPDERAPRGEWASIQAALDAGESARRSFPIGGHLARRLLVPGPLQAAAALVLFAGGVIAGLQFTTGRPAATTADLPTVVSPADQRTMLDGLNQIESLRAPLRQVGEVVTDAGSGAGLQRDPIETAQLLARLEGAIRALRERLDANPGDLFASASLLELVERRDRLTEELGRSSGTRTW